MEKRKSNQWWWRRNPMAIQQYDYTACCTGFLQQLPSFWGIRQKQTRKGRPGRSGALSWMVLVVVKAGGVGGCRGWWERRGVIRRDRRAHFAQGLVCTIWMWERGSEKERGKKRESERGEGEVERGLFLCRLQTFISIFICSIAETRKPNHHEKYPTSS